VSVVNLRTNTVSSRIPVGNAPEEMLLIGNRLYVTCSYSSALTVINTTTDAVESTIAVPLGSKNILRDGNGNIWVLCSAYLGAQDYMVRINPNSPDPSQQVRIAFPNSYVNGNLRTNAAGSKIYASISTGTYELSNTATSLPAAPLIRRSFYGLGIDPQDNTIYAGTGFTGADKVFRYTPAGVAIDSFNVVVAPNSFLFR
jgi:YVTN family beta-propeller protein